MDGLIVWTTNQRVVLVDIIKIGSIGLSVIWKIGVGVVVVVGLGKTIMNVPHVKKANIQVQVSSHLVVGVQMVGMQTERETTIVQSAVLGNICNGLISQKRNIV